MLPETSKNLANKRAVSSVVLVGGTIHDLEGMTMSDTPKTGWMVQYADESGCWHDYQYTEDPIEERKIVRWLSKNGNKTRTVITQRKSSEQVSEG